MVAKKTFTFAIDEDLKSAMRFVRERDGVSEAEQIRRALRGWLEERQALKTERKRAVTRKRS